ncbi:High-affinity branched-chain amino acid transport system permease protein LivH [Lutibaculum baratangense AMV1]|uniref:High-affinity branched-chain amino acid transport system permease protein LivH n=1 Tax=Lutibaculum baratangense AMV1 TaxID=631454 RepID=V4TBF5_9HYPH|nr:High-affinity branched-chain amino acid transport system permease protein LivH [Lutibaculum baratangense AMV1]
MIFVSALITGLGLGSMYGLLALGFYVTYVVSNTVNFAQGSTMMLGAVICFTFWVTFGWPAPIAVVVVLLACTLWGVVVERVAVRPFVRRGSDAWLMATVALGIVIDNVVLFTFGRDPRGMPATPLVTDTFDLAGLRVQPQQVLIPIVGLGLAVALTVFSRRTRHGLAMMAVVQNQAAARLMGINVGMAVSGAFALSGFFAGVAGILIAPLFTISSTMGTLFGIKAFAVAILGGITNPWGVMFAGLLYGVAEAMITASFGSTYTQIVAFTLVIVALALRPDGLFGRAEVKKV